MDGCICPHPPLLIDEVGRDQRERVKQTVEAMETLGELAGERDLAIVISPHTPGFSASFTVKTADVIHGDFGQFGARHVSQQYETDLGFVEHLLELADADGTIAVEPNDDRLLDHSVLVPFSFLSVRRLVSLSVAGPYTAHAPLGRLLRRCADDLGVAPLFVASGDLSHRLTHDGPYGFRPEGPDFDSRIVSLLEDGDFDALSSLDPGLVSAAGECGLRSLLTLGGYLGDDAHDGSRVLSYEGPFGVGYAVAAFGAMAA
jgi:MEMO1 family protein